MRCWLGCWWIKRCSWGRGGRRRGSLRRGRISTGGWIGRKPRGEERAVGWPVAGTTRDAISVHVRLKRGSGQVVDVAGMEGEAPSEPADARSHGSDGASPSSAQHIERQMKVRAHDAANSADV